MEPERHIEKLLRAYAKKRKDAAGAPPEMHPATRRLLQAEVARRAQPRRAQGWFARLVGLRRPGFAFALGFAAVTIVGVAVVVPSLTKAKSKSQSLLALSRAKQAAPADEAVRKDRQVTPESESLAEEGRKTVNAPSAPAPSGAPVANNVNVAAGESDHRDQAASSPERAGKRSAVEEAADKEVAVSPAASSNEKDFDKLTAGGGAGPVALKPGGEPAPVSLSMKTEPSTSLQAGYGGTVQAVTGDINVSFSNTQHFVQAPPVRVEREATKTLAQAPSGVSNVLNSFSLEQNGQEIRVVDSDGSVYSGIVQWTGETPGESPQPVRDAKLSDAPPNQKAKAQLLQNYQVTWSGQNRSLNQNVTFNGNMQAAGAAPTQNRDGSATVENKFQALKNELAPVPLGNARISGTAVIDNKQQIQVNAVSVVPPSP